MNSKFTFLIVISLLLSFALGASVGYFVPRQDFCGRGSFAGGPGGPSEKMKKKMLNKMSRELGLSNEQKEKVRLIFEAHAPEMKKMHEEMRPKFDAVRDQTREEIKKILTPDQITKFDELNARWQAKREKFLAARDFR